MNPTQLLDHDEQFQAGSDTRCTSQAENPMPHCRAQAALQAGEQLDQGLALDALGFHERRATPPIALLHQGLASSLHQGFGLHNDCILEALLQAKGERRGGELGRAGKSCTAHAGGGAGGCFVGPPGAASYRWRLPRICGRAPCTFKPVAYLQHMP